MNAEVYDPDKRAFAARLEARYRPRWVIWWGVGSRRYWAIPMWPGAPVPIVDGRTPNDLTAAIHQAESAPAARTPDGTWNAPASTVPASRPTAAPDITPTVELAAARP